MSIPLACIRSRAGSGPFVPPITDEQKNPDGGLARSALDCAALSVCGGWACVLLCLAWLSTTVAGTRFACEQRRPVVLWLSSSSVCMARAEKIADCNRAGS
jgi:hypothetical protein